MATEVYEHLIAAVFEARSFWVQSNTTLILPATNQDKRARVELDVIALKSDYPQELFIIECKSTAGSSGLDWNTFAGKNPNKQHRYRTFFDAQRRARIEKALRMKHQLLINVPIKFCLASSATQQRDYRRIARHLRSHGMELFGQRWLRKELQALAAISGYQNNIAVLAAQMLFHPNRRKYA